MKTTVLLMAVALTLATGGTAAGQMIGLYTIDSSAPTGGTNYANFQDCANDLVAMGVSGPVTIAVFPDVAMMPYAGFSLGAIAGTNATDTVTFSPAAGPGSVVISGPAAGFTHAVRFGTNTSISAGAGTGPNYVIFDGFEVTGSPSGAAIVAIGCSFITIRNCVAHTAGSGIGLGNTHDSVIEDCEVYGTTHVSGSPTSSSYSGGIFAYYLSARNTIRRNKIHDCADNGIFIGSSGSTTATPDNVVVNNFIWNCGTQTSATYAGGIACRRATNSTVSNNSISMPAASNYAGIRLMGGSSASALMLAECSNNIVQHNGTSECIQTEYLNATNFPAILDNNLYDTVGGGAVGGIGTSTTAPTTLYPTLLDWQTASASEANSVGGAAGFLGTTDLHITPSSAAFNTGSTVAGVTDDIDGDPRPLGGTNDIGADETPAMGLFAGFSADVVDGPAALTVNFTDQSYTSDAGGVTSWAWDFDNNGSIDDTAQNPSYIYGCPGTYSVSLTVTDATNPMSTLTRTSYITVGEFVFDLSTTGAGDLTITPIPTTCGAASGAASGWTLGSFNTSTPIGGGPVFGLTPDSVTFDFLFSPAAPGNLSHFIVTPGLYPDAGPFLLPPGSLSAFAGMDLDGMMIFLDGAGNLLHWTDVDRVTL